MRPLRIKGVDCKIAVPPAELKEEVVGHSRSRIFQLRGERDRFFCFQARQVGDANSREMFLIPFPGRLTESTEPHETGPQDDEADEGSDEHEIVHGDTALNHEGFTPGAKAEKPYAAERCLSTVGRG